MQRPRPLASSTEGPEKEQHPDFYWGAPRGPGTTLGPGAPKVSQSPHLPSKVSRVGVKGMANAGTQSQTGEPDGGVAPDEVWGNGRGWVGFLGEGTPRLYPAECW